MKTIFAVVLSCALIAGHPASALAEAEEPAEAKAGEAVETAKRDPLQEIVEQARALDALETLLISRDGELLVEEGFRGHSTTATTNIKSASKSVVSALVGVAIDKGILEGVDQKIAPILRDKLPKDPDPRIEEITIGHLLSMQAGLRPTSAENYGRWISGRDWVAGALAEPFEDDPGGGMLYSTGSTHLLSAILTKKAGKSTLELAREWLKPLEGFRIGHWMRDRQGIYIGGNQMAMSPRSMLAFGELYRNRGKVGDTQVIFEEWIDQSWTPRTRSIYHGDEYGYSWFISEMGGTPVYYAWGFGGQMIYVAPEVNLTVVMTSDENKPSASNGYRDKLHALMADIVRATSGVDVGAAETDEASGDDAVRDEATEDKSKQDKAPADQHSEDENRQDDGVEPAAADQAAVEGHAEEENSEAEASDSDDAEDSKTESTPAE